MEAAIITTYRCIQRCTMCRIWESPTDPGEEFKPALLEKLPRLSFCNVTGGEPFLREDLDEIVTVLGSKTKRLVISTNGYLTEKILGLADRHPDIGFRISLEGLPAVNDQLRGLRDSFDHGLRTLLSLRRRGIKDIGFGITVSETNARDMLELYELAEAMDVEFATAVVHNSYYFHTSDNQLRNPEEAERAFDELSRRLLRSRRPKNWYRAYFNRGLIEYLHGRPRLLPCTAGSDMFFLDPWGDIRPCNGMEESIWMDSFGNLHDRGFEEIWSSEKAIRIRENVRTCPKNCWMIGTASPAMKRNLGRVTSWVLRQKFSPGRRRP